MVARVEDEVLLEENDEAVFDLAASEVGGAGDCCQRLATMAGEDRVYPLGEVRPTVIATANSHQHLRQSSASRIT